VWNPQWELLGLYTYHGLLLGLLMGVLLMDRDRKSVPLRLVVFGLVAGSVATLFSQQLHPDLDPLLKNPPLRLAGLSDALWGAAVGVLASAMCSALWRGKLATRSKMNRASGVFERVGALCSRPENLIASFAITGVYLGYRATLSVVLVTVASALLAKLFLRKQVAIRENAVLPCLLGAAMIQIVFWKQIAAITPW